jgi:hypothetical protein
MTSITIANVLLTIPFLLAFIGIPLWIAIRRPETGADHSQAHRYLRARAALASRGQMSPPTPCAGPAARWPAHGEAPGLVTVGEPT